MQDWGRVVLHEEMQRVESKHNRRAMRWLNAAQLLDHYKMESVVRAVILQKSRTEGQWRPCPDCPEETTATEYQIVTLDETMEEMLVVQ